MGLFTKTVICCLFLKQLCWCHYLPVFLCFCSTHIRHIPPRLLWVCIKIPIKYTQYSIAVLRLVEMVCSIISRLSPPSTVQSQRSCSPTSHRWMNWMKVMSTFPQLLLQPLAGRSWLTKACTTPPPRLMALVQAVPIWLEHTWMMLPLDPMGPAALTALKQTAGDLSMYELMKKPRGHASGQCTSR